MDTRRLPDHPPSLAQVVDAARRRSREENTEGRIYVKCASRRCEYRHDGDELALGETGLPPQVICGGCYRPAKVHRVTGGTFQQDGEWQVPPSPRPEIVLFTQDVGETGRILTFTELVGGGWPPPRQWTS